MHETEANEADAGQIFCGVLDADARGVFGHLYVDNVVHTLLDRPMGADYRLNPWPIVVDDRLIAFRRQCLVLAFFNASVAFVFSDDDVRLFA